MIEGRIVTNQEDLFDVINEFQVDLIDFCRLRKRDPFGVLMRWVMTLKDHATGLTYLTALPRKQAHLVAYKLQEVFGVIGYPKIFHSDNGKEFTAKCVLELLRHLNCNIISVTGRPRRPRDQGSVENVNKFVKRVLGTVLSEQRMEGQTPNWTSVLESVAAVINSQCERGKNSVIAFEAVFGQKLDHPLSCSKSEARRCWTLKVCMLVSNEPDFDSYCKENYIIDDDDVYNATEVIDEDGINEDEDDDGYFSEDEVPQDKMDKVDDAYFNEHLMDNTATITPNKSPGKKKGKKEEVEPPSSVMERKKNNLSGREKSFKKVVEAASEVMDVKKKALSPDSLLDIKKKTPSTPVSKKGNRNKGKSPLSDSPSPSVADVWDDCERPSSPASSQHQQIDLLD